MCKFGAVVLAGGKGQRFHGKKQFVEIDGKPLWRFVYDKLDGIVDKENIVVVGVDCQGGSTRSKSLKEGLKRLQDDTQRVIIAEAARPLVTKKQLEILLNDSAPSSSFVMPLVNTVVKREGEYINREELYELLTPQAFSYKLLMEAMNSGRFEDMTDETRVIFEYFNIKPHFIETTENLIKVTYPRDLAIVERLLEEFQEEDK